MRSYLDFEKPVAELEAKVEELRALQHLLLLQPVADGATAPREEARANAIGLLADPQVEARRLELRGFERDLGPDQFAADHRPDFLSAE